MWQFPVMVASIVTAGRRGGVSGGPGELTVEKQRKTASTVELWSYCRTSSSPCVAGGELVNRLGVNLSTLTAGCSTFTSFQRLLSGHNCLAAVGTRGPGNVCIRPQIPQSNTFSLSFLCGATGAGVAAGQEAAVLQETKRNEMLMDISVFKF